MKSFSFHSHSICKGWLRLTTLATLLLLFATTAGAVPAQHIRRVVRLTDGTRIEATLYGNSHLHWLETDRGEVLVPSADGTAYQRTALSRADMHQRMQQAHTSKARLAPRRIGSQATAPLPATGSPKVPVLLVSFANKEFSVAEDDSAVRAYYDLYCNGTRNGQNYRGHGSYGSIRDYFIAQSDSLFQPEFVVIGPVRLDQGYDYYGKNSGNSIDIYYSKFRDEAVRKAVEQFNVDWLGLFDNRNKNQVDMVFFLFAGLGEANGGDENTIWPKDVGSSTTINKIRFASSACCNELRVTDTDSLGNITATAADGIGIMCHELSHAMGLPDFYDTVGNGFGMDIWSVMDYGEYCSNGYCPVAYTAYERDFMGWRPLIPLTDAGVYEMAPISAGGMAYKVTNDQNPDEYYILENRQKRGWDVSLGNLGHGMMVTHVDYKSNLWNANDVNVDSAHQHMTIIAANNRYVGTTISRNMDEWLLTWSGNLYPFEQNDSLTDFSTPPSAVFTTNRLMHKPIYDIQENAETGMVRFSYLTKNPTGAEAVMPAQERRADHRIYDLSGRRLGKALPRKGIYIQDGKVKLAVE